MTLPSSYLGFFQNQWTSRLVDSCVISRVSSSSFNTTTGVTSYVTSAVFSGACLVRPKGPGSAQYGQQETEFRMYTVVVPYTVTTVLPDDTVKVTSTFDGALNGKEMTVLNVRADTYNTARKLDCQDNQGG